MLKKIAFPIIVATYGFFLASCSSVFEKVKDVLNDTSQKQDQPNDPNPPAQDDSGQRKTSK
ncbi:MAG: hypothetical protein LBU89_05385 [Fibromonadaceae bacterium]|jgi:hypothetical protein|nr:hypothetical protein [Fibromonadaceae bacterium]